MNDVLEPVCQRLGINLVPGAGFQSITRALNLLQRVRRTGKPARVFYTSDFDPAGDGMPTATARQLEFWHGRCAPGADVKLTPLALSRDQVELYQLPRVPLKDTDLLKASFEQAYGALAEWFAQTQESIAAWSNRAQRPAIIVLVWDNTTGVLTQQTDSAYPCLRDQMLQLADAGNVDELSSGLTEILNDVRTWHAGDACGE
jgi:hypothetical protein